MKVINILSKIFRLQPNKSQNQKMIKSFVSEGDIIEVLIYGIPKIYKVEGFEVIPNNRCSPTEFVIHVKFSDIDGIGGIECTSDYFKYVRHIVKVF